MLWNCHLGLDTDIPVDDWHEANKKYFHKIHSMKAISQMDQKGLLTIQIKRVSVSPTTQKVHIIERLKTIAKNLLESKQGYIYDNIYVYPKNDFCEYIDLGFFLHDQAGFCDGAIMLAIAIHKGLGIEGPLECRVGDFAITQETMVWLDEGWITFANWLRMKHGLRIVY